MQEKQAIIERVRRVSAGIQRLDIAVEKAHRGVAAGQFFLARRTESLDPYLREPWLPIHVERSTITVEQPASQSFSPGQVISLIGPLGKPVPLRDSCRTLLLIAHEATPAALLLLAETALAKGAAVTLVLLGASRRYPLEALPQEVEVLRGDAHSGNWPNQAQTLTWADQIVAAAPPPYDVPFYTQLREEIRRSRVEIPAAYVWGLFHLPMPCGVGACQACLVRCTGGEVFACLDGPAFDLTQLADK
jgi:dihydroorotate dehydrogenase electron transfer subunit